MKLILLSGYAGSGKTTACNILSTLIPEAHVTAFADAVKDQVAELYGFNRKLCDSPGGKQTLIATEDGRKTVRTLLIEHSAQMKQTNQNPAFWADIVAEQIEAGPKNATWILHDWRYRKELQTLRAAFPSAEFLLLRIVRESVTPLGDPSEHDLDGYTFDHSITNNDSEADLENKLKLVVK